MLRSGLFGTLIIVALCATSARAQDAIWPPVGGVARPHDAMQEVVVKSGKADHEIPLTGHSRFDRNCAALEPPPVSLDQPPAHGTVCLRAANTRLAYVLPGAATKCLGQKVMGVRVIYLPRFHYTGSDMVRYTVRFPDAQVKVEVDLTVLPNDRPSSDQIPGDVSAPAGAAQQQSGPIAACAALVS
jgi:hypothetical protein